MKRYIHSATQKDLSKMFSPDELRLLLQVYSEAQLRNWLAEGSTPREIIYDYLMEGNATCPEMWERLSNGSRDMKMDIARLTDDSTPVQSPAYRKYVEENLRAVYPTESGKFTQAVKLHRDWFSHFFLLFNNKKLTLCNLGTILVTNTNLLELYLFFKI